MYLALGNDRKDYFQFLHQKTNNVAFVKRANDFKFVQNFLEFVLESSQPARNKKYTSGQTEFLATLCPHLRWRSPLSFFFFFVILPPEDCSTIADQQGLYLKSIISIYLVPKAPI